jgi:hypothetical protein
VKKKETGERKEEVKIDQNSTECQTCITQIMPDGTRGQTRLSNHKREVLLALSEVKMLQEELDQLDPNTCPLTVMLVMDKIRAAKDKLTNLKKS